MLECTILGVATSTSKLVVDQDRNLAFQKNFKTCCHIKVLDACIKHYK